MHTFHPSAHLADQSPLIRLIQTENDEPAVSARDLHKFLEIVERFSKWIDRMFDYGFEKGVDYTPSQKVHPLNKQTFQDYALTLDTAKEVAMLQRSDKGKQARRYFIECEKVLRQALTHVPQAGLVQLLNGMNDKVLKLEHTLSLMKRENVRQFKFRKQQFWYNVRVRDDNRKQFNIKQESQQLFDLFGRYMKVHHFQPGNQVFDQLLTAIHSNFNLDLKECQRNKGEHYFELAVRMGKGHCVEQAIRCHMYKSGELK